MSPRKVKVIILNFNLVEYTIECLKSLQKVDYPQYDILVVDNGSTDNSVARLKESFPLVEIYSTGENLGYTGGMNAGLKRAISDAPEYILALNPDTEVHASFLGLLVDAMERNPNAAGACGTIYTYHSKNRVWYAGGRMIPWRGLAVHDLLDQTLDHSILGEPQKVTFITGCVILFRTRLLEDVGLEDERFFMYLDDIELSARILKKGYELLYVPRAIVYHRVLGEKESPFKLYYSVRNRFLLINTGFSGFIRHVARVYFLCAISAKILVWYVTRPTFAQAATMGLMDYFKGNLGKGRGVDRFSVRRVS